MNNIERWTPYFNHIQKTCLPGVWSKGVSLARSDMITQDSGSEKDLEWVFRVQGTDRPVSLKVTLWPEDEDWYCDCEDRNDVCSHVAAVVVALKTGKLNAEKRDQVDSHSLVFRKGQLIYRFKSLSDRLSFDRFLVNSQGQEQILSDSLVGMVGGINSGRISFPTLRVTQEDFAIDGILAEKRRGELYRELWIKLFKVLSNCSSPKFLDDQVIQVSAKPLGISGQLVKEGSGYRLKQQQESSIDRVYANGVVLSQGSLKSVEVPHLTSQEHQILSGAGTYFEGDEAIKKLLVEILPSLEKKMKIEVMCEGLPILRKVEPKIILQIYPGATPGSIEVIPAFASPERTSQSSQNEIWISDPIEEKKWIRKLQTELQLNVGQRVQFESDAAVEFLFKSQTWDKSGMRKDDLKIYDEVSPHWDFTDGSALKFSFQFGNSKSVEFSQMMQAWRENKSYVSVLGGGWARLPDQWLSKYAEKIEEILAFKSVPQYILPEVASLCREMNLNYPEPVKVLEEYLQKIDGIQEAPLPADFTAQLRFYQKLGVNWLCFLRDGKMGAMLADDMGLGKTIQALCALKGKTLIVTPTSVLFSWAKQIEQFRPGLKYSMYYGNQRQLETNAQVILTSYGILRLDREKLNQFQWDTIILDEAHIIKNPDSQIAKAAHSLQGDFRVALSGTPLENKLEDLWSQFQFINPGLLGSLETFQERYATPMARGDQAAAQMLRNRVRPFILRRLKKEVAQDLPPRTEKILHCELNEEEWATYHALLASTRKEVIEKLESGESIFAALELILRLRQACCHRSLVPGQRSETSSKLELLLQTLKESIACGHRALVFSQWTSLLDLIEPFLQNEQISYSRLDGTTQNRSELVEQFQSPTGPSLMLLSLKAGGVGLTLTAADHIFMLDPWWNPAVEDQAADRSHRIGQTQPVLIHKLIAKDTLEERILELQKTKQAMSAALFQGTPQVAGLTKDDLLALLQ